MTISAAIQEDAAAIKKIGGAGYEIIVVRDKDFEKASETLEAVRRSTYADWKATVDAQSPAVKALLEAASRILATIGNDADYDDLQKAIAAVEREGVKP